MSASNEDDKEPQKVVPLDLARSQVTSVRTVDGKAPLIMTNQSLRNMRVLTTQGVPGSNAASVVAGGPTILATNLVSQTVLKSDPGRPQLASIITSAPPAQVSNNLTRPAQITLSASPLVAQTTIGTSYHVPRGPAVVANLAAPRSNVTTVRTPMVVTAQNNQGAHTFVRPPRTPSPAQGTAWLANAANGSQIKGAATVLSSPIRGATITGKPQIINRTQPQSVSTIRSGTILQNAITIGQPGQIHSFKATATGIQALGNTVTIAQVLPSRTQAVVYNAGTNAQFAPARITVANTVSSPRAPQPRPVNQVTAARLTVPVNVSAPARLITPQATVLTTGARISAVPTAQPTVIGSAQARIVSSTQPNVTIGRLSVAATPASVTTANLLGQARIPTLNLHSLVAVANSAQNRTIPAQQGAKVIAQPATGTIHLTSLPTPVKTSSSVVTTATRTISVPATVVSQQRQATQSISIAKVFPQSDGQNTSVTPTNVYIHAQVQPAVRSSPGPVTTATVNQNNNSLPPTTVAAYSIASGGTYFFENSSNNYQANRAFNQQSTAFSPTLPTTQQQHIRSPINNQVHVSNQQMRFNPVMVVEQNRGQQQHFAVAHTTEQQQQEVVLQSQITKVSSPRPSILRKRDHEGVPSLKAAKNLTTVLANMPSAQQQQQASLSPPPRPDSEGNGHSSGGSTTISATSSPGIAEVNEDSNPPQVQAITALKEEEEAKPIVEMSPRKKPRKQQLTGNELEEHNDDMQFLSESIVKKENEDSDMNQSDEPRDGAPEAVQVTTVRKPASASLLNSYRQNWKATHNHYLRHSDVRPKDERRPTIMDLANQYRVQDKVNGWKVHHLSTQMEDLADQENTVYNQLTDLLKCTESVDGCKQFDRELNRINELIKGNLQRVKIINDGMLEAKTSIMKIFDHKVHVTDIINRCASKRNFKKRDKS